MPRKYKSRRKSHKSYHKKTCKRTRNRTRKTGRGPGWSCAAKTGAVRTPSPKTRRRTKTPQDEVARAVAIAQALEAKVQQLQQTHNTQTRKNLAERGKNLQLIKGVDRLIQRAKATGNKTEANRLQQLKTRLLTKVSAARKQK